MSETPAGLSSVLRWPVCPSSRPATTSPRLSAEAAPWLADGDVVVVTSKVVSKVEGRLVHVPPGADRERMRLQAVEDEAVRVVARRGPLAIVQTRQGWVVAAAGIDASNVGAGRARPPARGRRRLGPRTARPAPANCWAWTSPS